MYISVLYTFFLCNFANGYGYKTHNYLGDLTDKYMLKYEPVIYKKILMVLGGENITSVSTWADRVKRTKEYIWTKPLHYIDILECREDYTKEIIDSYCENKCITSTIKDFTNAFKYNFDYIYENGNHTLTNSELLKFLIHFTQDFNQPMHLLGYDRGGNSYPITVLQHSGRNKSTNVHYLWDTLVPEYYINNYNFEFNEKVNRPSDINNLIKDVLNKNIQISCKIYPDSHYIIFDDYFKKEYIETLFKNYNIMIVSILKYIFN